MPRTVEFVPDGKRTLADPRDVVKLWRSATSKIPAQYAVGTASHESSFTTNEIDTEESGFVSKGIYQLSDEEAHRAGMSEADLCSLGEATKVLAWIAGYRLNEIVALCLRMGDKRFAGVGPGVTVLPDAWVNLPADTWFYLAMSHNLGLGAAEKSIMAHGLDMNAWIARNPNLARQSIYFTDCVTGGDRWAEANSP